LTECSGEPDLHIVGLQSNIRKRTICYTFLPIFREEEDRRLAQEMHTEMPEYFKNVKRYSPKLAGSGRKKGKGVIERRTFV
jgi:hypothetical protein